MTRMFCKPESQISESNKYGKVIAIHVILVMLFFVYTINKSNQSCNAFLAMIDKIFYPTNLFTLDNVQIVSFKLFFPKFKKICKIQKYLYFIVKSKSILTQKITILLSNIINRFEALMVRFPKIFKRFKSALFK